MSDMNLPDRSGRTQGPEEGDQVPQREQQGKKEEPRRSSQGDQNGQRPANRRRPVMGSNSRLNGSRRPGKRGPEDNNTNNLMKTILIWVGMFLGVFFIVYFFAGRSDTDGAMITGDQYARLLEADKISQVTLEQYGPEQFRVRGKLKAPEELKSITNTQGSIKTDKFTTNIVNPEAHIDQWAARNISWQKTDSTGNWTDGILSFLPWIILLFIWILIMRRMQNQGMGGTKGIFSFGKSRAKMVTENTTRVTFADVAGADEAKVELMEIIEFLKEPAKFQKLGGKIPRGVLLLGPPGTGKTLLARAVAGEAGVPFLSISGADFVEMFVGVGASRVRDLFEQAKKNAPCIVFIDEIDAVGRHRGAGLGGGHDEREQTLNQLLVEMDGFDQNSGVIMIAATNRPDVLDPALLRPGRFDRQVVVDRPDVRGREAILKVHTRHTPLGADVDLNTLAKGTPGLSGADLANLVNEAALLAARRNAEKITMYDFEAAKDKVMMGVERKSVLINDEEKKTTAYHEIGHVLVAKMIPESDPVHKVTIIPRGRALGVTSYLPVDEKHTYAKEYLEAVIAYALGGRAAERIIFNRITTGAGNDIERATDLARKMVCDWGMSEKLGPLKYGTPDHEVFLGRDMSNSKTFSDTTARIIDEEIRSIVENGAHRAETILKENIGMLHSLSEALLERETLDASEIDVIMAGGTLPPFDKAAHPHEKLFNRAGATLASNHQGSGGELVVGPGDKGDAL
jgi:cell division protease FtsH